MFTTDQHQGSTQISQRSSSGVFEHATGLERAVDTLDDASSSTHEWKARLAQIKRNALVRGERGAERGITSVRTRDWRVM